MKISAQRRRRVSPRWQLGLAVVLFLLAAGLATAKQLGCASWVCVGPCGGPGTCAGYGCVCVGYSTGVGRCVSE